MITRTQTKLIRRLKRRKRREREDAFLVEGVRLMEELLESGLSVQLVVTAPELDATERGRALHGRLDAGPWARAEVGDEEFARLSDTETPQGVLAVVERPHRRLSESGPAANASILVLDRLQDPGNVGTLLRVAYGLGLGWVVALPGTVDLFNPKAVRASAGAIFRMPVSAESWSDLVAWLRARNIEILVADAAGTPLGRGAAAGRFALVLGNEASGPSHEVLREADRRVAVELAGGLESLNVAMAGAILLDRLSSTRRRT